MFSVGPTEQWKVYLSAPSGGDLVPGACERATRWPFGDSTEPQLAASHNSDECNMLTGRSVIHTAEYGPGGDVSRFFGEFEQHCENGPAALRGTLHVNFPCTGDCSGDAIVTIDELLVGVAISSGNDTLDRCRAFDHDARGTISVDELVRSVGAALTGCQ